MRQLVPIRYGRMMQSPFTFYRGSAVIMAADLASTPASGIRVQACGDCPSVELRRLRHARAPHRLRHQRFRRDPAGALGVGPQAPGRQLGRRRPPDRPARKRCGAGGARHRAQLPRAHGRLRLHARARRVVRHDRRRSLPRRRWTRRKGASGSGSASKGSQEKNVPEFLFPKLAEHRGSDATHQGRSAADLPSDGRAGAGPGSSYQDALALYRESLAEHLRTLFDRYHFCDLAMKVVGVGSVGTLCGVALFMAADDDPIFLQVKEATRVRARTLCRQEPHAQPRRTGRRRPAPDAVGQRPLPGLDAGQRRPRSLRAAAARHEDRARSSRISTPATSGPTAASAAGRWPARMPARATPP